jgi:phosphopantetheinyl transferase (holo-ACP synthase)
LKLSGKAAVVAEKLAVANVVLSMTHTSQQAMALVILEN